nr:MAG TPA: hypothetical protein [Caudoviricetes sp.]
MSKPTSVRRREIHLPPCLEDYYKYPSQPSYRYLLSSILYCIAIYTHYTMRLPKIQ